MRNEIGGRDKVPVDYLQFLDVYENFGIFYLVAYEWNSDSRWNDANDSRLVLLLHT